MKPAAEPVPPDDVSLSSSTSTSSTLLHTLFFMLVDTKAEDYSDSSSKPSPTKEGGQSTATDAPKPQGRRRARSVVLIPTAAHMRPCARDAYRLTEVCCLHFELVN